jgi:hypothetical protein
MFCPQINEDPVSSADCTSRVFVVAPANSRFTFRVVKGRLRYRSFKRPESVIPAGV